jgi:2'-5' RNA ligase
MLGIGAHPELIGLQNRVKELCQGQAVEWNTPDTFHVTLAAFPALDDAQIALLRAFVASLQVDPMPLRIGSLGTFDNLGNHAIRFMIRSSDALSDLQEACVAFCEQNDIPVSQYSLNYKPHVTMGYSANNPGRLTYKSPLSVTPTCVQLSVDKDVAYERPFVSAIKSAPTVYGEPVAPLTVQDIAHAHAAPVVDVPDDIWLDDAEFKELKQWRILMARKGVDYEFRANVLPAQSILFGRDLLSQGYGIDDAADALKAHIVSMKKKTLTTPDGEEIGYDAWADYDHLKDEIGDVWLTQYQQQIATAILAQVTEEGLSVDALDKAFEDAQGDLIAAWTGTDTNPGPMSRLIMAGVAAGDASLKQGSAANPQRPVSLKAALTLNWNLANQEAISFIERYSLNLIKRLDRTTRDDVQKALVTWFQQGGTQADLIASINAAIDDPKRAALIGETESTRAYFEGAKERYRQADVQRIEWRTVNVGLKRSIKQPGDTCTICAPLHGKTGDLDKGVWSDKAQAYLNPPAHPRCRCWVVAADEEML